MKNLILKRIIFFSLWLISFISIIATVGVIDPDLKYIAITGKYFWFFQTQTILLLLTLIIVLFNNKRKYIFSLLDIFVILLISYCLINYLSRDQRFEIKLFLLVFLGLFYISIRIFIQIEPYVQKVIPSILIATTLLESIMGLIQLYGFSCSYHDLYKITGHFFNPGPFSGYIVATIPLAVHYIVLLWGKSKKRVKTIEKVWSSSDSLQQRIKQIIWDIDNWPVLLVFLSILDITVSLLIIPAAMSRSAWIAVAVGVLVILTLHYNLLAKIKSYVYRYRLRAFIIIIFIVVALGVTFIGVYNLKRDSADGRFFIWKISSFVMMKQPIFGVGLGNFSEAYGRAQYDYFLHKTDENNQSEMRVADSPAYAFNECIQIGVEEGFVGLFLFLLILVLAIKNCLYEKRKLGILGAILTLFVFSQASYPLSILPICIVFVVLLALSASNKGKKNNVKTKYVIVFLGCLLMFSCFFSLCRAPSVRESYKVWRQLSLISTSDYKNNNLSEDYAKYKKFLERNQGFLYSYGIVLSKENKYEQSNKIIFEGKCWNSNPKFCILIGMNYQAMGQFRKAEEYYMRSYYMLPNRLYPLYLLMNLYCETGQDAKAKNIAQKLLDTTPKVKSTATEEMKGYAREVLFLNNKNK